MAGRHSLSEGVALAVVPNFLLAEIGIIASKDVSLCSGCALSRDARYLGSTLNY